MLKSKILFQLTGSIACYKACHVISRLAQAGHEVEVVATKAALEFVGEATLEGLTGRRVHHGTFGSGSHMDHIRLIRWADLVILAPATANTINKMAAGIGDDLVTTLFLAHDFSKPYLVAPAMNTKMYRHPATQSSLKRLVAWGVEILEAPSGALACGEMGEGRLLEPDLILAELEKRLARLSDTEASATQPSGASSLMGTAAPVPAKPATGSGPSGRPLRVLITSGGTREPLDGVRAITNFSSGRTGARIAAHFAAQGHEVTFLHAEGSTLPSSNAQLSGTLAMRPFTTFRDLESALRSELGAKAYDVVIHSAAVGDYSVESIEAAGHTLSASSQGKIDSDTGLVIRLQRNPKLVSQLRDMASNKNVKVVAFKLTNSPDEAERTRAVAKLAASAHPDWIIHNDLSEIDSRGERHVSTLHRVARASGQTQAEGRLATKNDLATELERAVAASIAAERSTTK